MTRRSTALLVALLICFGSLHSRGVLAQEPAQGANGQPGSAATTGMLARPRITSEGITFRFVAPVGAQRVYLAGDFNAWGHNTDGKITDDDALMTRGPDGAWTKTVAVTTEIVRYKFAVVDNGGRFIWRADPNVIDRDREGNTLLVVSVVGGESAPRLRTNRMEASIDGPSGQVRVMLRSEESTVLDVVMLPALLVDGVPQTDLRVREQDGGLRIDGDRVSGEIEVTGDRAVTIAWGVKDGALHDLTARIRDNSRYYGGGERFNTLNQKGNILSIESIDRPEDKGTVSYKPVPWIMSTRGYGVWIDSFLPGEFDLNATDRENIQFKYRSARLRLVLITGPGMTDLLEEFTHLTGRAPVPPAWAFAPWKSRDVHKSRDEVIADAELTRKHGLTGSVIVIDSPWETGYNDFTINQEQFDHPRSMFARIKELGFLPCLWLTPFINSRNVQDMKGIDAGPSKNFAEAAKKGFLVKRPDGKPMIATWWKGEGGLVDFTNLKAVEWWHNQMEPMTAWGVAALKCDDGEGNFVQDAVFSDKASAAEMKNRYSTLYLKEAQAFLDKSRPGDGVLLARCGFTGTQRYPFCWAGDNRAGYSFENGLPSVILAGQNAAMSGIVLWGHDIAGYMGDSTSEQFVRWTQFGAFSPLMMVHMTSNKGPWDFGEEALSIFRTFSRLHTRLYPYLLGAATEARDHGLPIIRPMALAFQSDEQAAEQRYQYMFGPDLLVAPMYQGGTRRTVYLPKGAWIDFWSGAQLEGPKMIEAEASLDHMPLYVRAGAMIPMLPEDVETLMPAFEGLDPRVHPLDDRRVIEVWSGPRGVLKTPEGIFIERTTDGGFERMEVRCDPPRLLEVRWRFVRGTGEGLINNAEAVPGEAWQDGVVIKLEKGEGTIKLKPEAPLAPYAPR